MIYNLDVLLSWFETSLYGHDWVTELTCSAWTIVHRDSWSLLETSCSYSVTGSILGRDGKVVDGIK